jgi:hypothetical protein
MSPDTLLSMIQSHVNLFPSPYITVVALDPHSIDFPEYVHVCKPSDKQAICGNINNYK